MGKDGNVCLSILKKSCFCTDGKISVVITTKGLQDRNIYIYIYIYIYILDGTTVENKGKLILINI